MIKIEKQTLGFFSTGQMSMLVQQYQIIFEMHRSVVKLNDISHNYYCQWVIDFTNTHSIIGSHNFVCSKSFHVYLRHPAHRLHE